jgi:DNA mismatch repair ATPase MutL
MEDLSLHILDIVENSITAGANLVRITVNEDIEKDLLTVEISDNGSGMSDAVLEKADDPFFTQKTTRRVGLGLSLLRQAAEMAQGSFSIESKEGEGTLVRARFQYSHIDRQPLGNITETMETLVIGNPSVDFCYEHIRNGRSSTFDTREMRRQLGDISLSSPKGIRMIRECLERSQKSLLEANSK